MFDNFDNDDGGDQFSPTEVQSNFSWKKAAAILAALVVTGLVILAIIVMVKNNSNSSPAQSEPAAQAAVVENETPAQPEATAQAGVAQETATPQGPAVTETPGLKAPAATQVAVPSKTPTAPAVPMAAEKSVCPLSNQGVQIDFNKVPDKDDLYPLSGSMKELQPYVGCNYLIEGRVQLTEEHHIWVFTDSDWSLKIREGSLWAYPDGWNMGDFSTEKPPIAAEFVTAKRNNQKQNGYDWVIFVHVNNDVYEFPAGATTPKVVLPNNANFQEPEPIEVHGVWNGESFDASIGAEKTTTVALLDGELVFWQHAKDNIPYKSVQAWLMPSAWSKDQIEAWAKEKFPTKELLPYVPD